MNGWGQGSCGGDGQPACTYARIKGAAGGCDNPQTKLRFINAGAFAVFNVSALWSASNSSCCYEL